jgi:hypothetical protein
MEAIKDPKKKPEDKLRLFLIYYLSIPDLPDAEVKKLETALREAGCDVSPIQYAKKWDKY